MIHFGRPAPWDSGVRIVQYFETWPREDRAPFVDRDGRPHGRAMWHCWIYSDGWEHWERRLAIGHSFVVHGCIAGCFTHTQTDS